MGPSAPSPWCPHQVLLTGHTAPIWRPLRVHVGSWASPEDSADLCPPSTAQPQSTTWLATQPLSQASWLNPTRAESPYGPLPSSAKPSDPWTEPTGASMAIRLRTLECHPAGPSLAPHPQTDSRHTDCKHSIHLWQSVTLGDLRRRSLLGKGHAGRRARPMACKYLD